MGTKGRYLYVIYQVLELKSVSEDNPACSSRCLSRPAGPVSKNPGVLLHWQKAKGIPAALGVQ